MEGSQLEVFRIQVLGFTGLGCRGVSQLRNFKDLMETVGNWIIAGPQKLCIQLSRNPHHHVNIIPYHSPQSSRFHPVFKMPFQELEDLD